MKLSSVLLLATASLVSARAYREKVLDIKGKNFFDAFDFWTGNDPTNGYVNYVDRAWAERDGLVSAGNENVYVGVDNTGIASGRGRNSVRLESKMRFNRGLFLLDLDHMPHGCGTWPAFWLNGDNWPNNGEIDVIEGVNIQEGNLHALHTTDGCSSTTSPPQDMTSSVLTRNCFVNAPGQGNNQGCSQKSSDPTSYGQGLANAGGGVYALEWNADFIKIWWFKRGSIPADLHSANPEPLNWGTPAARFSGACDINQKFKDLRVIFNVTFCGDWAGNTWSTFPACAAKGSSCVDYIRNNPDAMREAYWLINSLKVFSY